MASRGVIIIGGGIGGLCAAIALRQAGLEVAVYERAEAYRPLGPGVVHLGAACTGFHVEGDGGRVTFADGWPPRPRAGRTLREATRRRC